MGIEDRLRDAHPNSQQYANGSTLLLDAADKIAELRHALLESIQWNWINHQEAIEGYRSPSEKIPQRYIDQIDNALKGINT